MVATEEWIASAARPDRGGKPVGAGFLGEDHMFGGVTGGLDRAEAAAAERVVRRMLNRHTCQAPRRLAEARAAGWRMLVDDIRAHPSAYCGDPRHDDDAALLGEALQWLGLRPTPPPARRRSPVAAYRRPERRGVCPECRRRQGLRVDGTVGAHGGCPGEGAQPAREGEA